MRCSINDEDQPIGVCLGVGTIGEWCRNCIYYVEVWRINMKDITVICPFCKRKSRIIYEGAICFITIKCLNCGTECTK
jgi:hypothetical protein